MAESASQISRPNESDFHDSHPLDEEVSPSLGGLGDLDSLPETDDSQSMGDVNSVALPAEDDVLGDISLLEEAFNEMDEEADEDVANVTASEDAELSLSSLEDELDLPVDEIDLGSPTEDSVPVLSEAVDEPTAETNATPEQSVDESIPVLDQQPTVFATEEIAASEAVEQDDASSLSAEDGVQVASEVASNSIDAEIESTPAAEIETPLSADEAEDAAAIEAAEDSMIGGLSALVDAEEMALTSTSGISNILEDENVQTAIDDLSLSDIENVDDETMGTSVDDKLAELQATSIDINEMPAEDPVTGISTEFANELDSVALSTVISGFDQESDSQTSSTTPHSVSVGGDKSFTLNIPFELHSQLSKKIDELVIDATTSLTQELNTHLSSRLEKVLSNSVEAVLPALANQLVNELRSEINTRVNEQLPMIINDVLGKTSLKDK